MDAYELHDARLIQEGTKTSAANALSLQTDPVPAGKVWTILSAAYTPFVAETKTCQWSVIGKSGWQYAIQIPQSFAAIAALTRTFPLITEGLELKLYPGEVLRIDRDSATAGSQMTMYWRVIETDLPLYEYIEPQERKRIDQIRSSVIKQVGGGGGRAGSRPALRSAPVGPRGRGV